MAIQCKISNVRQIDFFKFELLVLGKRRTRQLFIAVELRDKHGKTFLANRTE